MLLNVIHVNLLNQMTLATNANDLHNNTPSIQRINNVLQAYSNVKFGELQEVTKILEELKMIVKVFGTT